MAITHTTLIILGLTTYLQFVLEKIFNFFFFGTIFVGVSDTTADGNDRKNLILLPVGVSVTSVVIVTALWFLVKKWSRSRGKSYLYVWKILYNCLLCYRSLSFENLYRLILVSASSCRAGYSIHSRQI